MPSTVLFRADAGAAIGTGHVMRCLALSQELADRGAGVHLVAAELPPGIEERLRKEGLGVTRLPGPAGGKPDAEATASAAASMGARAVIVDGYQFSSGYVDQLRAAGAKVLLVDDNGDAESYTADIVVNQNAYAAETMYRSRSRHTRLLLGSAYALLRREFRPFRGRARPVRAVGGRILVTLGGSDPHNVTAAVLRAIRSVGIPEIEVVVVVGVASPHRSSVEAEAVVAGYRVEHAVVDMTRLYSWADIAVTAAGTTCWETAFMGLPSVTIALADNQRRVGPAMAEAGAAVDAGWYADLEPARLSTVIRSLVEDVAGRARMAEAGRRLVDGYGARRVATLLTSEDVTVRPAAATDAEALFRWANDADTRAQSWTQEPIAWDTHVRWLESRLQDPRCWLLVGLDSGGQAIGTVRFELEERRAVVSVNVSPEARGRGFGSSLLRVASDALVERHQMPVDAYVKAENQPSLQAFLSAGYVEEDRIVMNEVATVRLRFRRD